MRSHLPRLLAAAAALAVACPAMTPLPAQPAPAALLACAPPVAVTVIAPFTGQPGDVAIFAASAAPLAVAREVVRTQGGVTRRDTVCLGLVAPAGKRWAASAVDSTGALAVLGSYSSRSYAASVVWARSLATPPAWPTVPPTVPKDTAAPTSAPLPSLDSLAAQLGAPIVAVAPARALGPAFAAHDSLTLRYAATHWAAEGADFNHQYYGRDLAFYALCARSGDARWCARADSIAVGFRDQYLVPANYATSPHMAALEGLAVQAQRRGDDKSRYAIARAAEALWGQYVNAVSPSGEARDFRVDSLTARRVDPRIHDRVLLAQLLAWRLGGHPAVEVQAYGAPGSYEARIHLMLAGLAAWQLKTGPRAGAWPTTFACGGQNNFEAGLLHGALVRTDQMATFLSPAEHAAIVAMVARGVGYLWAQWTGAGFPYGDLALVAAAGGPSTCATDNGTQVTPDLSGLLVAEFGWLARVTGDAGWRTRGDAVYASLPGTAYWDGSKQFNQATVYAWRYLGWR